MRPEFKQLLDQIAEKGSIAEQKLDQEILALDYSQYLSPTNQDDFKHKLVSFFYDITFRSIDPSRRSLKEKFELYRSSTENLLKEAPEVGHRLNIIWELYHELHARGGMTRILKVIEAQVRKQQIQHHTRSLIDDYLASVSSEQQRSDADSYAQRYPMALTGESYQKDLSFYIHLYFEGILKNHYFLIKGIKSIGL